MVKRKHLITLLLLILGLMLMLAAQKIWHRQTSTLANTPVSASLRFARADWVTCQEITAQSELRLLGSSIRQSIAKPATPPNREQPIYQLVLDYQQQRHAYMLTHDYRLFNFDLSQEITLGPDAQALLGRCLDQLRQLQFGRLLPWPEADILIPRMSTFTITDLETGLVFRTQRRAGSRHADIQPLTREDTAILKQIYDGAWSWNRRAVIVTAAGQRIAASMHGMPHGAGALPNGFPGHHCLHFLGSSTHGSNSVDPLHQLMIHHAAGLLAEYLDGLGAEQLADIALELAGQGDTAISSLLTRQDGNALGQQLGCIRIIRVHSTKKGQSSTESHQSTYDISIYFKDDQREHRTRISVTCRYHPDLEKWLVEPDYISQLLQAR